MALGDVVLQVVELQWCPAFDGDTLPVATTGGTLHTGELPVEHAVVGVDLLTIEQGQDVDAIASLWQVRRSTSQRSEGGHDVGEIDNVRQCLHGHLSRLVDDERHADASLVELSLAPTETRIAVEELEGCLHSSAIVRGEDDEGIVAQMQTVQLCQQTANGRIHVGDERRIAFGVHVPRLVVVPHRLVDDVGFVGRIKGKIEEERILAVALDEADGIVGRDVGIVAHMLVVGILLDVDEPVVVETIVGIIIR